MSADALGAIGIGVLVLLVIVILYLHQISQQLETLRGIIGHGNVIADQARRGIRD
ncbi:hypothetical protein [Sphingomonas sp.]|uniref:hypothetical protein n=1 Tax=Sphingomonas sp. TaxID=28214 RepID=UPI003B003676